MKRTLLALIAVLLALPWVASGTPAAAAEQVHQSPTSVRVPGAPATMVAGAHRRLYYLDIAVDDSGDSYGGVVEYAPASGRLHRFASTAKDFDADGITWSGAYIWVVDSRNDRVGRLTVSGAHRGHFATYVVSGPDGDRAHPTSPVDGPGTGVWFAEPGRDAIAHITDEGNITSRQLGEGLHPRLLAVAGTRQPAFDIIGRAARLRVPLRGPIARYRALRASYLVAGPGRATFADNGRQQLVRINSTGRIDRTYAQTGSGLAARGPGRSIWISEPWQTPGRHVVDILTPADGRVRHRSAGYGVLGPTTAGGLAESGGHMWVADPSGYLRRM